MLSQEELLNKINWKTRLHMVLMLLVIVGSINWGLVGLFNLNLVDVLSTNLNKLLNTTLPINNAIYVLVAIAGIWLAMNRNTWLPFLGSSVLPANLLQLKKPEKSDKVVTIQTEMPNTKVVYWASLPKGDKPPVEEAYSDYSNSGVVMTDDKGKAELPILTGSSYVVPSGKEISRHVHYRLAGLPWGMVGKVMTVNY